MLVLGRNIGETLVIGNDITVTLLEVNGNQVRLGVSAPTDVPVDREEIFERKQREAGIEHNKTNGRIQVKKGIVANIKPNEGYGFIQCNGRFNNIFFHRSSVEGHQFTAMRPGQEVNFKMGRNERGVVALDVKLA